MQTKSLHANKLHIMSLYRAKIRATNEISKFIWWLLYFQIVQMKIIISDGSEFFFARIFHMEHRLKMFVNGFLAILRLCARL